MDLDSIEFMTFMHANSPRISGSECGIIEAVMPCAEMRSRFIVRFESMS
jgi:hypothetical protein